MNGPKTTLDYINFLYEGLKTFYPALFFDPQEALRRPIVYSYKGIPKSKFLSYTLDLTDTNSVEGAVKVLLYWRELLEKEGVTETVPAEIGEMVERLENYEKLTEQEKQSLDKQVPSLKQKLASEQKLPKPPGLTRERVPYTQIPKEVVISKTQQLAPGLKIAISPATTKGITSFAAKALFAPVNFVIQAGGGTSQIEGTAASLSLSFGVTSSALSSAINRRPGLSEDSRRRLEELVGFLKNIETGSPALVALARRAYGVGSVQLIFDIQELGIPQAQIYDLVPRGNTFSFAQNFFAPVGRKLLGKASSKILKRIAGKKAVATVAKIAGKKLLSKIGAAIGGAIGNIPGAIIGWIGSEIVTRVGSWLKRHKEVFAGIVGGIAGFLVAGIPGLIIGAGLAFGAALIVTQGTQAATAQVGGAIQAGLIGITSIVLPAIGVPFVIALISIPIIIAIILFIINSGAYLVPPRPAQFTGIVESPYISVEKTASPDCLNRKKGKKKCPNLPGAIKYDVKITAKKGVLTNVSFDNKYQVLGEGSDSDLPPIPPLDAPEGNRISPTDPYEFSYTVTFGKELDDSFVLDTLTVTADAPEQKGAVASDVASVIIGDPPASSCPILGGNITTGSYRGASEVGHGSNPYWSGPAGSDCGYDIPAFSGCFSPTEAADPDGNNICQGKPRACSYYGYATDVGGSGGTPVFLPSIFGKPLNWTFNRRVSIADGNWGYGYLFSAGEYQLYLGHLNRATPPSTAPSGTVIGTLYPGLTPPHVHIELQINGQWVRPDFLCGGVGP